MVHGILRLRLQRKQVFPRGLPAQTCFRNIKKYINYFSVRFTVKTGSSRFLAVTCFNSPVFMIHLFIPLSRLCLHELKIRVDKENGFF